MRFGRKTLFIVLLFVALVLLNYLAANLPVRLDATAERIYTLSPGTKALLGKIEEPITLDFYYSQRASGQRVEVKNYAERVLEMLRQYVRAAQGRITLHVIDPVADTPEEEKATAAGVRPQRMQSGGETFYLGLVATQADQQKALSSLNPDREQFLEFDISQMLYGVQQIDKKRLGLLTSLPLQGTQPNFLTGQGGSEGQYVVTAWIDTFSIVAVDPAATELPAGLDALAVAHPQNVSPRLQFAIDQFLLGGKPVFLAVDPSSLFFKRMGSQGLMFGGPPPNLASDLPALFAGWGLAYDPTRIVGDNDSATPVQLPAGGVVRHPIWLSLGKGRFNLKSPPTAQLSSMLFVEAGGVGLKPGTALNFTPLVETAAAAGDLATESALFAQPDALVRQLTNPGKRTLAALVTGKFKTAFPGGQPKEEPKPDADQKDKPAPPPVPPTPTLKESSGESTLLVVADTDWLFDDYSLRKFNSLGEAGIRPLNDNLAFAANALDYLAGSQDLLSIRGKGNSLRPFTVVQALQARANRKYQEQLAKVEAELTDVQTRISELQGRQSDSNRLVASPEVTKAIEDFNNRALELRAEVRSIRLALRSEIDALEQRTLLVNLLGVPVLICLFGVWFHRTRKK